MQQSPCSHTARAAVAVGRRSPARCRSAGTRRRSRRRSRRRCAPLAARRAALAARVRGRRRGRRRRSSSCSRRGRRCSHRACRSRPVPSPRRIASACARHQQQDEHSSREIAAAHARQHRGPPRCCQRAATQIPECTSPDLAKTEKVPATRVAVRSLRNPVAARGLTHAHRNRGTAECDDLVMQSPPHAHRESRDEAGTGRAYGRREMTHRSIVATLPCLLVLGSTAAACGSDGGGALGVDVVVRAARAAGPGRADPRGRERRDPARARAPGLRRRARLRRDAAAIQRIDGARMPGVGKPTYAGPVVEEIGVRSGLRRVVARPPSRRPRCSRQVADGEPLIDVCVMRDGEVVVQAELSLAARSTAPGQTASSTARARSSSPAPRPTPTCASPSSATSRSSPAGRRRLRHLQLPRRGAAADHGDRRRRQRHAPRQGGAGRATSRSTSTICASPTRSTARPTARG